VPHLYTTVHDLTTGLRKPFWSNSPEALKFVQGDLASYLSFFTTLGKDSQFNKSFSKFVGEISGSDSGQDKYWANITYTAGFYNPFFIAAGNPHFLNNR
jgi:hypothetical protein